MARAEREAPARPAAETGTGPVFVATKLHPPAGRRVHVPRPALVARLAATLPGQLAVVSAPAGFGKTTLLADWYAGEQGRRPVAWLSLDAGDDDPVRFLGYVAEALRRAVPEFGEQARAILQAPRSTFAELMLPAFVNELEALPAPVALVLEDYHLVTSREVHDGVAFLVEHLPPTVALVLVTRSDPALPLARLRARGELTEVRAEELRFSVGEAAALLRDVLRLDLAESQVARLHERTEGWAAGLYLAALSLRGRPDVDAFIEAFAGDDRHVVDYLAAEVLDNQPEDVRSFLVRTSVLERLSGPLCDAVLEGTGSARTLEEIERSNLFVIPLDTRRVWYRYHRLFASLLRRELDEREPELVPALHRRAASWFADEGETADVVRHLLAAGDADDARELVARHWNEYFNRGGLSTVARWLADLPRRAVLDDPELCVAQAWIHLDLGELDEAGRWIELAAAPADPAAAHGVAILRVVHGFKAGDAGGANASAQEALELDWSDHVFGATVANCLLGITCFLTGRADEAAAALAEAARLAEATENDLGRMYALGYLALLAAEGGAWEAADARVEAAAALAADPARAEHFVGMMAELARGRSLAERGDLAGAETALRRAVRLSGRGAGRLEIAYALLALADVRQGLGDRREARGLVRSAAATLAECPDPGLLADMLAAAERRVGIAAAAEGESDELTDRELAVLRLLATDLSRREIASALYVSLNTVKTHTRGIFRKLGASTREEAVERARSRGLV